MRRVSVATALLVGGAVLAAAGAARAAPVCVPIDEGKLRCEIRKAADCDDVIDLPYARNLFCPAAFNAVQTMVGEVAKTLGAKDPADGFFYFYQTPPDPDAQSTVACMDTPAPYPGGSKWVIGAGKPLCHLVAHVTSAGPDDAKKQDKDNPVPNKLRSFPDYFGKLFSPGKGFPLAGFRTGSKFDPIVIGLGTSARDGFIADYRAFSPDELYLPDKTWQRENSYHGVSGGGGGGWGGEIAILSGSGPVVQLAFGGGGGGGMTSFQPNHATTPVTALGAGGGGGMQFANGYRHQGQHFTGLGLGAGTGSADAEVEYSYNDYEGSVHPALPVHQYNAPVIADYEAQLKNLADLLKESLRTNKTVTLRGGGGMGAGAEYLMANGQEFEPHALSTQAGFQFSYQFRKGRGAANDLGAQALDNLNEAQEDLYAYIGDAYRIASKKALEECGGDYSNFACMCPREHAHVICFLEEKVGSETLPHWLQQRHCPGDAEAAGGLTGYQKLLLGAAPPSCTSLVPYFNRINAPVTPP